MRFLRNWFRKKGTTAPTSGSSEHCYFVVSSGNASLIRAFYAQFVPKARTYNGSAGHYSVSLHVLETWKQEARNLSLPFLGHSYRPGQGVLDPLECAPVSYMHEVLHDISMGVLREAYIAFVSVGSNGSHSIQSIYKILRHGATSQNIFCNKLYVTQDKKAAEELLRIFNKIA